MPLVRGDLVFDATCIPDQKHRIGTQFILRWDGARGGALSVTHDRSVPGIFVHWLLLEVVCMCVIGRADRAGWIVKL